MVRCEILMQINTLGRVANTQQLLDCVIGNNDFMFHFTSQQIRQLFTISFSEPHFCYQSLWRSQVRVKVYGTSPVEGNDGKTTVTNIQVPLKCTNHTHYLCCFRKVYNSAFREDIYLLNKDRDYKNDSVMCLVTAEIDREKQSRWQ